MSPATHRFDSITETALVEQGSNKWTTYPGTIGMHIAEMDFGVADPVRKSLDEVDRRDLFGYAPEWLYDEVRRATSDFYADLSGYRVPPERIDTLPDVLMGLNVAMDHFSAPGSKIVLLTPAYMPFFTAPTFAGREVIEVPMIKGESDWTVDYAGLDAAFKAGGGLLVFVNPHNPIGKVYSAKEIVRIGEVVEANGARVYADEIHAPLVYSEHSHVPYTSVNEVNAGHAVTAIAATKAFNIPGLKCAQMLFSNQADLAVWKQKCLFTAHMASNPGLFATAAAYTGSRDWLAEVRTYLEGNRDLVTELLPALVPDAVFIPPQGTYIGWLDLRATCARLGIDPSALHTHILEKGKVSFTDGALCGTGLAGHLRMNFATPRPILREALERTAAALSE